MCGCDPQQSAELSPQDQARKLLFSLWAITKIPHDVYILLALVIGRHTFEQVAAACDCSKNAVKKRAQYLAACRPEMKRWLSERETGTDKTIKELEELERSVDRG